MIEALGLRMPKLKNSRVVWLLVMMFMELSPLGTQLSP